MIVFLRVTCHSNMHIFVQMTIPIRIISVAIQKKTTNVEDSIPDKASKKVCDLLNIGGDRFC
ncbi:MAG: hypothetical protein SAK29_37325 [Scytonema sp. PMC 1069.18]|nr:hypothetical protein [Scytonema sp. PMC 1069.18]MEC4882775.1 hypothetical protein [Scytonema sp. PMC 1070.18]